MIDECPHDTTATSWATLNLHLRKHHVETILHRRRRSKQAGRHQCSHHASGCRPSHVDDRNDQARVQASSRAICQEEGGRPVHATSTAGCDTKADRCVTDPTGDATEPTGDVTASAAGVTKATCYSTS